MRITKIACASALACVLSVVGFGGSHQAFADQKTPPYVVENGKVDKGTYNGYRRYASTCHVCHGPDGVGSTFAPALVDSLKRLSYDDFVSIVAGGKESNVGGILKVMPSWANNPDVMDYIDDIYGYLKARSDGALPGGRPTRIGE